MTTTPVLLNNFWSYLRKKLTNKKQLKQEINIYEQKMTEAEE